MTFLKSQQVQNGTWNHPQIGATALAGLTLLECQVPLEDPAVQKTASAVRGACVDLKQTYSLSLVILFLDRLGDPGDESFIQSMTTRLLAGQTASCGWSYNCPLVGQHREEQRLRSLLNQRTLVGGIGPTPSPPSTEPRRTTPPLPPPVRALLQQVAYIRPPRSGKLNPGDSDNSNTHFALIALWVARRHGLRLPVGGALAEAAARFRWSQYGDGSWGYKSTLTTPQSLLQPVPGDSSPAMTCAGLLGLGVARGASRATIRVQARDALTSPAKPRATADVAVPQDPAIRAGLLALARAIGQPAGDPTQIRPAPVYGNGGRLYYFLWSLERVAVVYGLDHIGKKDWYAWGSEILLASQDRSGGWTNGEFSQGCCDTCFALLFLRRANLATDLSHVLRGQVPDPVRVELTCGGVGNPVPPESNAETEVTRLGKVLVSATGSKREQALAKLREGKGPVYTEVLAQAIAWLEGQGKEKAREALAERLARMTMATLGEKLSEDDAEIRRAAALACAMREDRRHCARLIEPAGGSGVDGGPGGTGCIEGPEPPGFRPRQRRQ